MFKIYEVIESVEQIKKSDVLFYAISKSEIINKDLKRIRQNLEILKKAGKDARGKLYLTVNGYENDNREIYMIPEIRSFIKSIWEEYKYLFYFLVTFDNNRAIIFACLNDFKVCQNINNGKCNLEIIYDTEIKNKTIDDMLQYGLTIDDIDGVQRVLFTFI